MAAPRRLELDIASSVPVFYPDTDRGTFIFSQGGMAPELPKLIHFENVIPTPYGKRSLYYAEYSTQSLPATPNIQGTQLLPVRDASGNEGLYYIAGATTSTHRVFKAATGAWVSVGTVAESAIYPTVAYLLGDCYVFHTGIGVFTFTTGFAGTVTETVQGITATSMLGICPALNYLIAWDSDTVYWAAPDTPLDFRPVVSSVTTGAGSSKIADLDGVITRCVQIPDGFIIYGQKNAVSARYSGNSKNPWIFREIRNSSGLQWTNDYVGASLTANRHFVYSQAGVQELGLDNASTIFPELSAYLASNRYTLSAHNGTFTKGVTFQTLVKITLVSERYVCVSYKTASTSYFSGIHIYDIMLKEWGHIAMDHYDTFDFTAMLSSNVVSFLYAAPGDLCIWTTSGHLRVVYLLGTVKSGATIPVVALNGELVWSDFSLTRNSRCSLTKVVFDKDVALTDVATLHDMPFRDNAIGAAETQFTQYPANSGVYLGDVTAESHRLRLYGAFDISGVSFDMVQRGKL